MQHHLEGFGLENFRVFKEYTWFDFAPITLLVGPNSSGKSSLTKGLSFFKNLTINLDMNLNKDEEWLQLGDFERLINDKSENKETITFSYPYYLNHFPTIGVKKKCVFYLELHKEENQVRLRRSYIKIKNEVLLESNEEGLKFNIKLFNELTYIDEDCIKVSKQQHQDLFIKGYDYTKEFDFNTISEKDSIEEKYTCVINTTKLFLNDDEELINRTHLVSQLSFVFDFPIKVVDIYKTKAKQEKDFWILNWNDHREVLNGYKMYLYEDEFIIQNPLLSLLYDNNVLGKYAKFINDEVIQFPKIQNFSCFNTLKDFCYHSSHLGNAKRIYRKEENDYFNQILTNFNEKEQKTGEINFLQKWAESFKLTSQIEVIKNSKFGFQSVEVGRPLVEQGFGITQLVFILLKVVTINDKDGFTTGKILNLEEPEANLHPAFQSKLADMFYDAKKTFNQQFIIETHSEYMVRKFQYLVAKGEMKKEDVIIYYFHDPNNVPEGEPQVKKIEILEDGSLSDDFGAGFFDEADNLAINLFNLQNRKN